MAERTPLDAVQLVCRGSTELVICFERECAALDKDSRSHNGRIDRFKHTLSYKLRVNRTFR
jgi:hypothetical protein